MCHFISNRYYLSLKRQELYTLADPVLNVSVKEGGVQFLPAGSTIPNYKGKYAFKAFHNQFRFHTRPEIIDKDQIRKEIVRVARRYYPPLFTPDKCDKNNILVGQIALYIVGIVGACLGVKEVRTPKMSFPATKGD